MDVSEAPKTATSVTKYVVYNAHFCLLEQRLQSNEVLNFETWI